MEIDINLACPCGSLISFKNCCRPFLENKSIPKTAEQLMRSRYVAFVLHNADYLNQTYQPTTLDQKLTANDFDPKTHWLGLKVIDTHAGQYHQKKGSVEFVAFFEHRSLVKQPKFEQLHEISQFEKKDGKWCYLSGTPQKDIKLSRNDLCFCGSEKKCKKCHAYR